MFEINSWHIYDLAQQRHQELQLRAKHSRLIRRIRIGSVKRDRFYGRVLVGLGRVSAKTLRQRQLEPKVGRLSKRGVSAITESGGYGKWKTICNPKRRVC